MKNGVFGMTKVLYTLNASCRHLIQYFAISQSKVPGFDLMLSITTSINTSPQNRFLYSCVIGHFHILKCEGMIFLPNKKKGLTETKPMSSFFPEELKNPARIKIILCNLTNLIHKSKENNH